MIDYKSGQINKDTFHERMRQREKYVLRPKEQPADPTAPVPMVCPAAGPSPTAICPLKESSLRHNGKTRIQSPPEHPPKICTNKQSVTFPMEVGLKHRQKLQEGTAAHYEIYTMLRNGVEGVNGFTKDPAYQDIGEAGRRRVRGLGAQSLLVAMMVMAANLRKIEGFLEKLASERPSARAKKAERRRPDISRSKWAKDRLRTSEAQEGRSQIRATVFALT